MLESYQVNDTIVVMNNKISKPPVVALYLRVSTSQQDHEMQRSDLLKEVEKMSATVFHEYTVRTTGRRNYTVILFQIHRFS